MEKRFRAGALLLGAWLASSGCGEARPVDPGRQACTSWEDTVSAQLAQSCASCHSGASPAAGYDVSTYTTTLEEQGGKIVAVAGSASSLLLTTLDPATATDPHKKGASVLPTLRSWVVDCNLNYSNFPVHAGGIMNPASADFHGAWLRKLSYDTTLCQKCHGKDLKGGNAQVSCFKCHQGDLTDPGTASCLWCHGQPPASGAHQPHYKGSALAGAFDCTECHVKPARYTDVGHIVDESGKVLDHATITFGALANQSYGSDLFSSVTRPGPASYDATAKQCTNIYCHGGAFAPDSSATNRAPHWDGGADSAKCGTCHGLPPGTPSHLSSADCSECHPKVADAQKNLLDVGRHLDGKVSLGDESGTCSACHGAGMYGAPPKDLHGNTDPKLVTIGAHDAHLKALHKLRGPLACGDCHNVPTKVDSVGHLDHPYPASVFPATVAATSLGFKDGATPAWDHGAATCSNVYCHGGGTLNATDMSNRLHRTPLWTGGTPEAECGSCHGVPPVDINHTPDMTLQTCNKCHAKTIDSSGLILVTGAPGQETSSHIDGTVDVNK